MAIPKLISSVRI